MNAAGVAVRSRLLMNARTMSNASRAVKPADIFRRSITWAAAPVTSSHDALLPTAWMTTDGLTKPLTVMVLMPSSSIASIVQVV